LLKKAKKKMKIQYVSDLHIDLLKIKKEDSNYIEKLIRFSPDKSCDWLVLVGDICDFGKVELWKTFFYRLIDEYECIVWLPGNHEYYGCHHGTHEEYFKKAQTEIEKDEKLCKKLKLLDNECIYLKDLNIKLIFSCLYSFVYERDEQIVELMINDFNDLWTVQKHNELHLKCVEFIKNNIRSEECKNIVFSHFPPVSRGTSHPRYEQQENRPVNDYFASDCYFDLPHKPEIWIFGHTHYKTDFVSSNTRFSSRPFGYVNEIKCPDYGILDLSKININNFY
jgi:hypothetical protein